MADIYVLGPVPPPPSSGRPYLLTTKRWAFKGLSEEDSLTILVHHVPMLYRRTRPMMRYASKTPFSLQYFRDMTQPSDEVDLCNPGLPDSRLPG